MELAVVTETPIVSWLDALDEDPALISTAVAVLEERERKTNRGR